MLRRLHSEQPETFAFTPGNLTWAEGQIAKYPEGRQASAVIPLLWRAQEQEGWVSKPAIETIAEMLGLAYIRVLEVASFYFMFQLKPVGTTAHIQVCGTTSCMICGAEDLIAVCKEKIAPAAHQLSDDGAFSWEEVECLGACANAPMAQIGKDYYEDLTAESFGEIIDAFARGEVPKPGSRNGRFASEPASGLTSLSEFTGEPANASVALADAKGDTNARILGEGEIAKAPAAKSPTPPKAPKPKPDSTPAKADRAAVVPTASLPGQTDLAARKGSWTYQPDEPTPAAQPTDAGHPKGLETARDGGADDLKKISGVGPKLEKLLNSMGFYHFDQLANWTSAEVAWVNDNLEGFKGRVTRDKWVEQAKEFARNRDLD